MKTAAKVGALAVLVAAGVVGFACGGGGAETGGATTPTASASHEAVPAASSAASTEPAVSSAPAAAPAPPLVIAAMKLNVPKMGVVEVKDDGTVLADNKPKAKFVGAELQDLSGKAIISVGADRVIEIEGTRGLKFNDKDEVEVEDGAKISVGDDGAVKLLNPDGKPDKDSGKVKFTGFKPTARRAATLLVIALLTPKAEQPSGASASSAAPKPSAAPSAKPATKK